MAWRAAARTSPPRPTSRHSLDLMTSCHEPNLDHRYAYVVRPLRYSINVTLDGCCDHRAIPADEDLHRHAAENLNQADALLFGRATYEMMESAWRPAARAGGRPEWREPLARRVD